MPTKPNAVSTRRRAFADAIARGLDGVDAARAAGYQGSPDVLKVTASKQLRTPEVQARLAELKEATTSETVATVTELKEFWTKVLRGQETVTRVTDDGVAVECGPSIADRLKAAELLGKTEALFIDRKKHEGGLTVTVRRGSDAPSALPPKENP